jgi:hypothetical protein
MSEATEIARHGSWSATVTRVDVKAFAGRTLFFWYVQHDKAGTFGSGHCRDRDEAVGEALAQLARYTDVWDA